MTDRNLRLLIGAIAAAAAGVVTYLAGQGILTLELATGLNALIAGLAGYYVPKVTS